ncbi:hypothetical protein B5X24_HaOG207709 [Helicoverpa armigera]|uniref:Uncharacterized protein n=1 Tax=Helicoverpa armigera TaxID=29058 RepID=A0A2W1BP58_HELAM|nr:hypothetical protein B5X24_HaOG207709 [Helicoverpa armigera]
MQENVHASSKCVSETCDIGTVIKDDLTPLVALDSSRELPQTTNWAAARVTRPSCKILIFRPHLLQLFHS